MAQNPIRSLQFGAMAQYTLRFRQSIPLARHLYFVVACKAASCGRTNAVKYHGLEWGKLDLSGVPQVAFDCQCGTCGAVHRYEWSDTRVESFNFAPPPDWKDKV
jgi:hypothetical protein